MSILPRDKSAFYVRSEEASLLFVPYNGNLSCMSLSCLEFILQYFTAQVEKEVGFIDRRIQWLERERGDCMIKEKDVVESTWVCGGVFRVGLSSCRVACGRRGRAREARSRGTS